MKNHPKHINLARRKMSHIVDEIYNALLHYGSGEVDLRILREKDGLRLFAHSDYAPEHLHHIRCLSELLQPAVRNAAMVEMYWELAGEDQYGGESELSLVGQMADSARVDWTKERVNIELYVAY